ncbi:MAG: hypothetical protein LBS06_03945, partial [Treponema sp.]|nr:hypothetical protein [Treponema sp.]
MPRNSGPFVEGGRGGGARAGSDVRDGCRETPGRLWRGRRSAGRKRWAGRMPRHSRLLVEGGRGGVRAGSDVRDGCRET